MFAAAAALRADTGLITTFAGNGVAGSGGVGGPAVSANLYKPYCLSSDAAGNIYVANGGSGAINKIDAATSVITHLTTVLSGSYSVPGAVSQIFPCVASDPAGNLYISDAGNHRLLRRDVATGNITTIAGTGSVAVNDPGDGGPATAAGLSYPTYVVLDAQNNIYVSQAFHHRVRRIDAATGNISTVAGTGVGGYNGDGIAAVSAMLNQPWGLATDAAGNLYIAETLGYRIRKVNVTSGIITTAVGSGVAPTDFVDPNASFNGDNIPALAANLRPIDVAVDSTGNILVSTHLRLRRVDAATGMIQSIAGMGNWTQDGVQATHAVTGVIGGIKVLPNGNILIAEPQ